MNSTIERCRRQSALMWSSLSVRPAGITPCLTAESCIARSESANVVSRSPTDPSLNVSSSTTIPASVRTRTGSFSAPDDDPLAAPRPVAAVDPDHVVARPAGHHVRAAAAHVDPVVAAAAAHLVAAGPGEDDVLAGAAVQV